MRELGEMKIMRNLWKEKDIGNYDVVGFWGEVSFGTKQGLGFCEGILQNFMGNLKRNAGEYGGKKEDQNGKTLGSISL